ncbi:Hypothetical protein Minf_2206 [Methylacidiphilum infernorum V4]|uniref:Uncharacterized protein n=1 Tax=Methylacidiphilum infernorum (isolate V4) TaxID=481448 RepID=B3DZS5_METI4|nr:Hypothetical protein Minf_2206 [Methylacidiphilum infernorum V4]
MPEVMIDKLLNGLGLHIFSPHKTKEKTLYPFKKEDFHFNEQPFNLKPKKTSHK